MAEKKQHGEYLLLVLARRKGRTAGVFAFGQAWITRAIRLNCCALLPRTRREISPWARILKLPGVCRGNSSAISSGREGFGIISLDRLLDITWIWVNQARRWCGSKRFRWWGKLQCMSVWGGCWWTRDGWWIGRWRHIKSLRLFEEIRSPVLQIYGRPGIYSPRGSKVVILVVCWPLHYADDSWLGSVIKRMRKYRLSSYECKSRSNIWFSKSKKSSSIYKSE